MVLSWSSVEAPHLEQGVSFEACDDDVARVLHVVLKCRWDVDHDGRFCRYTFCKLRRKKYIWYIEGTFYLNLLAQRVEVTWDRKKDCVWLNTWRLKNLLMQYKTEITNRSVCITTETDSFPITWHWDLSEPALADGSLHSMTVLCRSVAVTR